MILHISAYLLYTVSLFILFYECYRKNSIKPQKFKITESIKSSFSVLSEILLSYVFWTIHKASYEKSSEGSVLSSNDSFNSESAQTGLS